MTNKKITGYKAFNKNLSCKGYQFEIGKIYEHKGKITLCESGFHFCKSVADCYRFYPMNKDTRICKVKAIGDVLTEDNIKYVTNKILILSEVKNPRIKSNITESSSGYCNSGDYNSGDWNSGDYNNGDLNSGKCNSGDYNSGNYNSGDYNSGYCNNGDLNSGNHNIGKCNSGDYNSGNYNSGDYNSGYYNSGNKNSGNWNSGDWNSGDYNNGAFNSSITPTINMFNKPTNWTYIDWRTSKAHDIMKKCPCTYTIFIPSNNMTDEEKANNLEYETIGGYIKMFIASQEDKQKWWDELNDKDKKEVMSLPNFDPDIFESCTGIRVKKEK